MVYIYLLFLCIIGLSVGSFLNAHEWRLAQGIALWKGRSMCPSCRQTIIARDLIPVFSFLWLQRKCRHCHVQISWQYPLVELWMGISFTSIAYVHLKNGVFITPEVIRDASIVFILTFLFVYDLKYQELPDIITLPSIIIIGTASYFMRWHTWQSLLIGAGVGAGVFLFQYIVSKGKWIGGGDIRLGALMGVILGWPAILVALFLAYVGGSIISVPLLLLKKTTWKSQLPFGTFLTVATLMSMIWGERIVTWYLGLIRF